MERQPPVLIGMKLSANRCRSGKIYPIGIGKSCVASILPTLTRVERLPPFARSTLPGGVMVARVTLDHLVQVRVLTGQLNTSHNSSMSCGLFNFMWSKNLVR